MKKFILFVVCAAMMLGCFAYAETGEYLFIENADGLYVCGYTGSDGSLVLPASRDGEAVVGISKGAFSGNTVIIEVRIPEGYKVIGESAFEGCSALRDVFIGSTLEVIEARAFANCGALLGVSITTTDFYADATAFEGSNDHVMGMVEREELWNECNGTDYDSLYVAGVELIVRGEFEKARDIFLSLYGYEFSADYYFYCCARIYESRGEIDRAVAIYAVMPGLNDCSVRLEYYGGSAEVDDFMVADDYTVYCNELFGEGGMFADVEISAASGADSGATIGGMLVTPDGNAADAQPKDAEASTEDTVGDEASSEENDGGLVSYHDYCGDMPYQFNDYSQSEGYYSMYYFYEDIQPLMDYIAIFEDAGWVTYSDESDGWMNIYVSTPDQSSYFYVAYSEADSFIVLMYETGMDYGFDPANGL